MKALNELAKEAYLYAQEKGFYEQPTAIGTRLMLIVSEIAEALEADRKNQYADLACFDEIEQLTPRTGDDPFQDKFRTHIKDTFEDEIADTFIRLFDLCGYLEIDIERHIELKMRYNAMRPYKHGKNY